MEVDTRVMLDLKRQIEKGKINFRKSPKERVTEAYVTTRLEALEVLIKLFTTKHEAIISSYDEKTLSNSSYMTEDIFNNGYETYLDYKGELKQALANFKQVQATSDKANVKANSESMLKLPKISIPTFSGIYSQWTSFRDLFESLVHHNAALDDVQRLHYLKTQVTGEAERLIKHLPITQGNYKVCWDLLQNRYNNKRFMSNCILKRLFNQRCMNFESANAIKDLLDTTSDCLHEMSNLGIDVSSWDVIVIYIVSLKLDAETFKQWELQVSNSCGNLPSFQQLKKFSEARFRALEFVEPSKTKPNFSQKQTTSTKVMHTVSNDVCPHCTDSHKLYHCNKFSNEVVDKRRDIAKALNACFNCLGLNHGSKQCRTPIKCRISQRKHHTLLHPTKITNVVVVAANAEKTSKDNNDPEEFLNTQEVNTNIQAHFSSLYFHAGEVWLPHHAVVRADKLTTKTRVVFNASSKGTNGVSLNDTLMVGPPLQPDLRHIVMRWRIHPICLTADIVKMYRQIKVSDKHVDYQRIVWRNDEYGIQDYRLLRVTFGTSCAPYLAVKSLQQVAVDEGHKFPLVAEKVRTDFYMDDLMTGCQTEQEAVKLYEQMNEMLEKGCFTLQKWSSNKLELLEQLRIETVRDLEIKIDEVTKILGLTWNRRTDDFDYTVKLSPQSTAAVPETKRKIIAEISRLYDPLGWLAPCIITAKVFIQKLWIAGLNWDDNLPEHLLQEWHSYRTQLSSLVNMHIPRWLSRCDDDVCVELHGFSDASNAAYAAVVYMRVVDRNGVIHSNLVTAKTKVAPIKQISIPRLELCGAVLVAKLLEEVAEVLDIKKSCLHAWTDSTIVLAWLSDHPSRWQTFVANRTAEILTRIDSSQWSYVQSKENPADCASRGLPPSKLLKSRLWKEGPKWLKDVTINYKRPSSILTRTEVEAKRVKAHAATSNENEDLPWVKFSSVQKLVRVIAYCRRFLLLKTPENKRHRPLTHLTAAELREALKSCIKYFQNHFYANVMKKQDKKNELSTLNPFIDSEGLLRVSGRIDNSSLPEDSKHPITIPDKSHLAKLLVTDAHERTMHGGQQLTITYLRSKYWIPKVKNIIRSHIHGCVPCIRHAAATKSQLMGQLPSCRVTPNKPFLCSGVDYAGPINMRVSKGRGQKSYKGYICLFVCMCTRAVHIEAVSDLTTEGFLAAFKRFVARRGRCSQVWSDNGSNFVGASKELKHLFNNERNSMLSEVANTLANNGTEWHFIPPHAPNFGGLWEAGIKSAKHHLKRVISDFTLTYEEMSTVLTQIEACLNSRPLWQLSTNSDDPVPLTPGHFLVGEPLLTAPDGSYDQAQIGILRRWQLTQKMVQQFWRKWAQVYLANFFQRYKWNQRKPEPKVGDIVLVKEDNLPPAKWLYGRVVGIHPGKDHITRVVTLRHKASFIKRPTSKLCVLPCNNDNVNF